MVGTRGEPDVSDWPAPDCWCTICDRGAEGGLHDPEDAPDWMHDLDKPWGIAALKPTTGSPSGGPEPLEGT